VNRVLIAVSPLNGLLMPLVVELVKERALGLALRVIRLAVRLLPHAHQDRYREEWTAELDAVERQNASPLVFSLRILLRAPSVGLVLCVRDRRQLLAKDRRERLVDRLRRKWVSRKDGTDGWALIVRTDQATRTHQPSLSVGRLPS
jgi:hypothetical protein